MNPLFAPLRSVYPPATVASVQDWLGGLKGWQVQRTDCYRFEGVDLNYHAGEHAETLRHLVEPATLRYIEGVTSGTWGVVFSPTFRLEAHRLGPGDYIAPHSDADLLEARAVVSFPSNDLCGGDLVFHGTATAQTSASRTNEGVVFICSTETAHSVTRVQRGVRYSICYRFELLD